MTTSRDDLRATLALLQQQLADAEVSAEQRAKLDGLVAQLNTQLSGTSEPAPAPHTVQERLQEASMEFQSQHPQLSAAINQVLDGLGTMGI